MIWRTPIPTATVTVRCGVVRQLLVSLAAIVPHPGQEISGPAGASAPSRRGGGRHRAHHAFPAPPNISMWCAAMSFTAERWTLKIDGGSYLPGCSVM